MSDNFLQTKDLKIGMRVTADQLSRIVNKYMIIAYDNVGDKEGILVYMNSRQNKEYDKWFKQEKPITPIHHTQMELEENIVYDE